MSDINFLPRRLDRVWGRLAYPEALKSLLAFAPGNPAYNSLWDDFHGDALRSNYPASVGVNTQVVGVTAGIGGLMTLATAGADGDGAGQGFGLHWKGDNGIYFIARAKLDTLATSKFELGLTDAVDDEGGAVDTKATPTFTATDCAVFVRDTADDVKVTFVTNGGSVDGAADWTGTFAADTYYTFEIVVQNDVASGFIDGQLVGSGNVEGGNALTPWAFVESIGAASARTLTVDYWGIVSPR
jgi:hypothetical protein